MVHPWQHAEGFGFSVWVWCVPLHHLGTINHMHTMGLVEFLDSLLMVHPWQHDKGFGFSVWCVPSHDLRMINHDKFVDSAFALADRDSVLKALRVDCNTWSSDCIDGDDQGLMFMITLRLSRI